MLRRMRKTARASMVRMLPEFRMMALPKSVIPRAPGYPDTGTGPVTVGLRHGERCSVSSDSVADEPVVAGVDGADADRLAGPGSVDHHVAAEVDAIVASAVHDDDVAGQSRGCGDRRAARPLAGGRVRQRDAELGVDVLNESGAVEPGRGCPAVDVGNA